MSMIQRPQGVPMPGALIFGASWACCSPLHCSSLLWRPRGAPMPDAPIYRAPWARHLAKPIPGAPRARRPVCAISMIWSLLSVCPRLAVPGDPEPPGAQPLSNQPTSRSLPRACPYPNRVPGTQIPHSPFHLGRFN